MRPAKSNSGFDTSEGGAPRSSSPWHYGTMAGMVVHDYRRSPFHPTASQPPVDLIIQVPRWAWLAEKTGWFESLDSITYLFMIIA